MSPVLQAARDRALGVDVRELPRERLPEYIELAAYFVVAEALRAARSADARSAWIEMSANSGRLTVAVSDDGRDEAAADRRIWLRGLEDRLAEIGGQLEIEAEPGRFTTVRATIPCA